MKITKAIIPVAGWGTRRLPITKAIEKCMLPIGNRPIVDYVVEDCIKAGITDVYFVISENSTQLKAYYDDNVALNNYLTENGKADKIPSVTASKHVRYHYIIQPADAKYGTAIPVSLAMPHLHEGESAVVLMGDDFIYNRDGSSEVVRLLAATSDGGCAMAGVNVPLDDVSKYGVLKLNEQNEFMQIIEKPTVEEAPSTLINVSKYVLNYELLSAIARYAQSTQVGEYYITEPINRYVAEGGAVKVVEVTGVYLDGGSVEGWLAANNTVLS